MIIMNCEEVDGLIIEYIEGFLDGETMAELELHVRSCRECKDSLAAMKKWFNALKAAGKEWEGELTELKTCSAPPEYLQKALRIAQNIPSMSTSVQERNMTVAAVLGIARATLIATFVLKRPYAIRRGLSGAPVEDRLLYENDELRSELFRIGNELVLSIAAKKEESIGKYICVAILSADYMEYDPNLIQWKQGGPGRLISRDPIDLSGRADVNIAETDLDFSKEEHFRLLEQIFEEIELELYEIGS